MDDMNFDNLFDDFENDEEPIFDPSEVITIRSTAGGQFQIPVEPGETLSIQDALARAQLTVSTNIEYWVGDVTVAADFEVGPGSTVIAAGRVKGG